MCWYARLLDVFNFGNEVRERSLLSSERANRIFIPVWRSVFIVWFKSLHGYSLLFISCIKYFFSFLFLAKNRSDERSQTANFACDESLYSWQVSEPKVRFNLPLPMFSIPAWMQMRFISLFRIYTLQSDDCSFSTNILQHCCCISDGL